MLPGVGVRFLSSTVDNAPLVAPEAGVNEERREGKEEGTNVVDGHERSNKGVVVTAVPTTPNAGLGEVG